MLEHARYSACWNTCITVHALLNHAPYNACWNKCVTVHAGMRVTVHAGTRVTVYAGSRTLQCMLEHAPVTLLANTRALYTVPSAIPYIQGRYTHALPQAAIHYSSIYEG